MPLQRRKRAVLPFLVSGMTVEAAARESGTPAASIRRWLREDTEFQDALDRALDQQLEDALNRAAGVDLSGALSQAVKTATDALKNSRLSTRTRLAAARLVWDLALKIRQLKLRLPNG